MMQRLAYAALAALALAGCNNAANDTRSAVGPDGDVLMDIKTPLQTGDLPPQGTPQAAEQATTQGAASGATTQGAASGGTTQNPPTHGATSGATPSATLSSGGASERTI